MSQAKRVGAFVGEHLLLLFALAMMIPPIPSEKGVVYSYFPSGLWIAILAAASRWCALTVERESWYGLIMKTALLVGTGFVMHVRVS